MSEIDRGTWVEQFKKGFRLGRGERKRPTEKRRRDVTEKLDELNGYGPFSDAELDAVQAGYELALDKWHPGAGIEVEQKANSAFDRSDYGATLGDFA